MRNILPATLLSLLTATLAACNTAPTDKPAANATPATYPFQNHDTTVSAVTYPLQSRGTTILTVTGPSNLRPKSADGSLDLDGPQYEVEFWLVPDAQAIDAALPQIPTRIVDQFKDFKPDHTADLTIAGSPAKRLHGTGREADDGDPGEADVIVFKRGNHIFIACNHGEGLTPVGQQALLTLVRSAHTP